MAIGTTSKHGGTEVSCRAGTVRIANPHALGGDDSRWRTFLIRTFGMPEVESVELDRGAGTATVHYPAGEFSLHEFLERLSVALTKDVDEATPAFSSLLAGLETRKRFQLFRQESRVSTWRIVHELPGRLRIRESALRDDPTLARQVQLDLRAEPGVTSAKASALTGSLIIRFRPDRIDRDRLLSLIDEALGPETRTMTIAAGPSRLRWLATNATVACAVGGEFVAPGLFPVCAGLLVASNLRNFQQAGVQLGQAKVGLPLLNTCIVGGTLATGGYLAASLMNWLLTFWQHRIAQLTNAGQVLLSVPAHRPVRKAWLCLEDRELETDVARLIPGDVVAVRKGDWIPVDGPILSGTAILEENQVKGRTGLSYRRVGHRALEGAFVVEGELRIGVQGKGDATIQTAIARSLTAAAGPARVAPRKVGAAQFADRAVPPVLLTAGLGLLVGDATAAAAILRPDFDSGPGLGHSSSVIEKVGACFDEGIVVRHPDALERMAGVNLILLDDSPAVSARGVELVDVDADAASELTVDEIVQFAECALREFGDPRGGALAEACRQRGIRLRDCAVDHRDPFVELCDGQRTIRVEGIFGRIENSWLSTGFDDRSEGNPASFAMDQVDSSGEEAEQPCDWTIRVSCNGRRAGWISFAPGTSYPAADVVDQLRERFGLRVELLTNRLGAESEELIDGLRVDDFRYCPTDAAKADWIRELQEAGARVAYVGDSRENPLAARAADLSVFPIPDPTWTGDPSAVWLLDRTIEGLVRLREIASANRQHSRLHYGLVLVPNAVCIAGAFLFGFTTLAVVVLSNLGTFSVYSSSVALLRRSERRALLRRRRSRSHSLPRLNLTHDRSRA